MSTEIDELEKRIARLEKEFRAVFGKAETIEPAPGSDAEHPPVGYVLVPSASADKIKSDWLVWAWDQGPWKAFTPGSIGLPRNQSDYAVSRPIPTNEGDSRLAESVAIPAGWKAVPEGIHREIPVKIRRRIASGAGLGLLIYPDPSIPWGEGYEAILPSEATEGNEYWSMDRWWRTGGVRCHPSVPGYFAWRRRIPATTPTEPARDLSADGTYWRDTAVKHFESLQKEQAKNALLRDQLTKMLEGMR